MFVKRIYTRYVQQNESERIAKAVVLHRNSYRFAWQRVWNCDAKRLLLLCKTMRFGADKY